jgi:pyridoxine 5-phosphate synthase
VTRLGVNIDHIATLRQQRQEGHPNLIEAAKWAIDAGADNITVHLREDRRHIQDQDIFDLITITPHLNFECALSSDIIEIALKVVPKWVCIVPEKRHELTTEGGLNLTEDTTLLKATIQQLQANGSQVSLFINPQIADATTAHLLGANSIEIHTGPYSLAPQDTAQLQAIQSVAAHAKSLGLNAHAGHGLNYNNIQPIAQINAITDVNIGHSIICKAINVGLYNAVIQMKQLLVKSHHF